MASSLRPVMRDDGEGSARRKQETARRKEETARRKEEAAAGPSVDRKPVKAPGRLDGSWFEPLDSKIGQPLWRSEFIPRPRLVEKLRSAPSSPLILVTAPAGYGKTTLLTEWGLVEGRPFAWLTLDASDNDASRLLTYIVSALRAVIPLGPAIFPRSPEPGDSFTAFVLPRLLRALANRTRPFVLVIDDVDVLHDRGALDLLRTMVENMPDGSNMVLACRDTPPLPISRFLVNHALLGIGSRQLVMSQHEGLDILHAAGIPVGMSEASMIVDRTEGWPAGLALAAMALREQEDLGRALDSFAGTEGLVADYLRHEVLERLARSDLEFMLGTAALNPLCGQLCDAVLETSGSAELLERSQHANLFTAPVDRNRLWFRRHQMFSEMLVEELRRRDPEGEQIQHRRAAEWFQASGYPDSAFDHAMAAGDMTLVAEVISRNLLGFLSTGRATTIRRWIESLALEHVNAIPWFAAAAATAYASSGETGRGSYWLNCAQRSVDDPGPVPDGRRSLQSAIAISRASLGTLGFRRFRQDAEQAYELEAQGGAWGSVGALLLGTALGFSGDLDGAEAKLHEAVVLSALEVHHVHASALAQLGLCAFERGDWRMMRELAERARAKVEMNGLQEYPSLFLVYAVSALSCAHWRQPAEARRDAGRAERLLRSSSGAMPWNGSQGRILLVHVYLRLGDLARARQALHGAVSDLSQHGLEGAVELDRRLDRARAAVDSATGMGPPLTAAEMRILQFLPTHLSFREIAAHLHVSRNTVKTQVISAYRKLGAASRTEAVEAARTLALLDVA